jgi:hypothetical protein
MSSTAASPSNADPRGPGTSAYSNYQPPIARDTDAPQVLSDAAISVRRSMSARRKRKRERGRRHQIAAPRRAPVRAVELHEASAVEPLAYSRRQAAEALGVSISTIDRRVVPTIDTVKTPWGQRLIPVDELERFLRAHLNAGQPSAARRPSGRPPSLPQPVVERVRLEYTFGRTFGEIARRLTADGVPTAHGGRRWWPSTVRAVLLRTLA